MFRLRHISSLQGRLGFIFLAFLLLLIVSIVVTFQGLNTQREDARAINLAGRQRMLLQQMTRLSYRFDGADAAGDAASLRDAAISFEKTLNALQDGGEVVDYTGETLAFSPARDEKLKAELFALQQDWVVYRSNIDRLLDSGNQPAAAAIVDEIERLSPGMIEQADGLVLGFERISSEKASRLRDLQLSFLVGGILLLIAGWWISQKSVIQPLSDLEESARRIGKGDLSSPVAVNGPAEVQILGATLDTMRAQVLTSQQDLQQWAEKLENRVQQRTRELEALAAVSQEINSHLSVHEVLTSVTEKAMALLGSDVASLCLLDESGKMLNLHATAGPESAILQNQSPADSPVAGTVLRQSCAYSCGLKKCEGFCRIIDPAFRTSHMAAPLHSGKKVIGALCVGSSAPDVFRPEMISILTQLAGAASVAMENSRLYQQAEHAAALEERQRIASEMHDGLLQTLSFLGLMVRLSKDQLAQGHADRVFETLKKMEKAEDQAESEIRRAVASLQDDFPMNDTLQQRLSVLAEELSAADPPVCFETALVLPVVLSRQESEQALRVAREAILNAQHHSRSEKISLYLEKDSNEVILTVKDWGAGFSPELEPRDGRSHFGMKIMQARAARLGGKLIVRSNPGIGTEVRLIWTPASGGDPGNGG